MRTFKFFNLPIPAGSDRSIFWDSITRSSFSRLHIFAGRDVSLFVPRANIRSWEHCTTSSGTDSILFEPRLSSRRQDSRPISFGMDEILFSLTQRFSSTERAQTVFGIERIWLRSRSRIRRNRNLSMSSGMRDILFHVCVTLSTLFAFQYHRGMPAVFPDGNVKRVFRCRTSPHIDRMTLPRAARFASCSNSSSAADDSSSTCRPSLWTCPSCTRPCPSSHGGSVNWASRERMSSFFAASGPAPPDLSSRSKARWHLLRCTRASDHAEALFVSRAALPFASSAVAGRDEALSFLSAASSRWASSAISGRSVLSASSALRRTIDHAMMSMCLCRVRNVIWSCLRSS
mmetsp:Transcript_1637/g.3780  ORF Transcript_1637/g.3780 Transcript_1637/m.3780 type:complete len:345 (+) Transcript_1637:1152-2186(+)